MSAGTITLTNGSAVVGGAGTSFATELAGGDFIVSAVGGVSYTLPVKTVDSNTKVTLVSNFTGPTQAGAAWSAVPRVALNMVTAALVAQSAEALRGLNYDKQNWQQVYSAAGNITVKLPDGTTFTGPSWKYLSDNMATKSGGAVPVNQGGTGSTTAEGGRTNLGLGNSATRDVDNQFAPRNSLLNDAAVMAQCHRDYRDLGPYDDIAQYPLGMSFGIQSGGNGWGGGSGADIYTGMLTLRGWNDPTGGGYVSWQLASTSQGLKYRQGNGIIEGNANVGFSTTHTLYSTQNATKASDGTLKAASPVARIVASEEECQRPDIAEDGFSWCGCGTANAEAEGVKTSRLDVGVYVLTGSAGLASEGWQLLPPMDPGGMGELGVVEAEQTDNGELTIRLFKRKYMLSEDGEIIKTKGELMDVPANSWIDVRLDMPDNSIWNQNQKEAMKAEPHESAS